MDRISFDKMAMELAIAASKRSEDPYKKVGCAILDKQGRVMSVGYNGLQPKQKIKKCFWNNRSERRKYIIHAETNALSYIKRSESPYLLASTLLPCACCAMNIASYGIEKVLFLEDYSLDQEAKIIFNFYNIKLYNISDDK